MPDAVTGTKKGGESGTIWVEDVGEKRLYHCALCVRLKIEYWGCPKYVATEQKRNRQVGDFL